MGKFLADQEVNLDPGDSEYEGFLDLPGYLAIHAAPDKRREDEARLVHNVGGWMGEHFYGAIGDKILAAFTPAIVHLRVPAEAEGLLYRPWELGHVKGRPLALQDVSLIFEVPDAPALVKHVPVGNRLRILAVFSLPVDANALNLRQERYLILRPESCAINHSNPAVYSTPANGEPRVTLAHGLAGALIFYQTSNGLLSDCVTALAWDLTQASLTNLPTNFDELCTIVEQTEGVHFRKLFSQLPKRAATGDEALQRVLEMAR